MFAELKGVERSLGYEQGAGYHPDKVLLITGKQRCRELVLTAQLVAAPETEIETKCISSTSGPYSK